MTQQLKENIENHIHNIQTAIDDNMVTDNDSPWKSSIQHDVRFFYRNNRFENEALAYEAIRWIIQREDAEKLERICEDLNAAHPMHIVRLARLALKEWTKIESVRSN